LVSDVGDVMMYTRWSLSCQHSVAVDWISSTQLHRWYRQKYGSEVSDKMRGGRNHRFECRQHRGGVPNHEHELVVADLPCITEIESVQGPILVGLHISAELESTSLRHSGQNEIDRWDRTGTSRVHGRWDRTNSTVAAAMSHGRRYRMQPEKQSWITGIT